jgi:glutamate dehydrogenase
MPDADKIAKQNANLQKALENEGRIFQEFYLWLEHAMPPTFFNEVSHDNIMLITHNLMGFHLQDFFCTIHLKRAAIVLCLDSADADLRILKDYALHGIKNYQAYVSNAPPPIPGITQKLRIAPIYFTQAIETIDASYPHEAVLKLRSMLKVRNPAVTDDEFQSLISEMNSRFLRSLSIDRLILSLDLFFKTRKIDSCQYEVRYNDDWEEKDAPSMEIVLAWRNTPKQNFLYRIARVIHRHGLVVKRVNATYISPYSKDNVLIMALGLHGSDGKAVWDVAKIPDFLRELATVKYFPSFDLIDTRLISKGYVSGAMGNFLRSALNFIHQNLVNLDPNLYTIEHIEEALCHHPELTTKLCKAFTHKFDPEQHDYDKYLQLRELFWNDLSKLDTGNEERDILRKNVLRQGMNMIHHTLKTNFYQENYTSLSFRLDPRYLDEIPFDRIKKFPVLPWAIFYIKGMHFSGFHIRFKELARGGLRTVIPDQPEKFLTERNNTFLECYNLALTQHLKNKDIPEGGSKAIILLGPLERLESEALIFRNELEDAEIPSNEIENRLTVFKEEQKWEFVYQAQRSFVESLITLVNCNPDGTLRATHIVDYWKRPEYLYIGPDENLHNHMINWIADYSSKCNYKPGSAFISGKQKNGINHREYGVTSLGVNVYMHAVLKHLGLDPFKDSFTIKMSGGPDGDVAGNQIANLYRFYLNTANLVALTDASGTIQDLGGLNLKTLFDLYKQGKPIKYYPPEQLHEGGFLVDKDMKRHETNYVQYTRCWRKHRGKVLEDWLTGSEMNHLMRNNVHQTKADIFIPAGGRPRTLNDTNIKDFLDQTGKPTARAIVEGANLYLTGKARKMLEKLGVIIVKDSSANKTGVIASSFEVLCGLGLGDTIFAENKQSIIAELLERLKQCASNEAQLLLRTHQETGEFLTDISEQISERINQFTYQILDYLDTIPLNNDLKDPLIRCFLRYCLPTMRGKFREELLKNIPDHHKKAIIACHIAAQIVYHKGLKWFPTIVDILPVLLEHKEIEL